ncbi:DNA topoisomerase [Inediibacterium massiliense]|uniref:DNA topoisomerase n=1 Tax=Inediibacterium massiliense TaxID=1658111 RepID=UPI0006B5F7C1|nr:DNA topoisomerase [Inediibacterium massiliense]
MSKALYITEKPSVALEFAKVLNIKGNKRDGYIESNEAVISWCVGHLVNMSYPEKYDPKYKKWTLEDLPFLPKEYKYEIIKNVKKQFDIVKTQMKRKDISTIYVCTDSGREGEYIYRLVDDMVKANKIKKRVWIDSQTEEEIKKGVKNAKPLSEYDHLSDAAYLRAKEDYLMGINFSRLLTLCYGNKLSKELNKKYVVIAVGRVMTCVLGMIVQREREIRDFVKTPYYKIVSKFLFEEVLEYEGEWKALEGSKHYMSNLLFKDIGFKQKDDAIKFIEDLKKDNEECMAIIHDVKRKKEKKNPPLLYNLAELQNECSKKFKLSPDETLKVVQKLYERKMLTYPRTDARVLSKAVAKEVNKNIKGLLDIKKLCNLDKKNEEIVEFVQKIFSEELYKGLEKTKYVNDKAITDHYAIIPTGQGIGNFNKLAETEKEIFLLVVRRFLAIFYPQAIFNQLAITTKIKEECFFTTSKVCIQEGYLEVLGENKKNEGAKADQIETLKKLKKGQKIKFKDIFIKESETTPPKRYNSGSMILAMENAGKLIEDDELREQIKGSGIGTSATRAEILNKLQKIQYVKLNKKTQILTPTQMGERIYDVVYKSIPSLLKPELTASWEKGLGMIANGEIKSDEYMTKLESYIIKNTQKVLGFRNGRNSMNLYAITKNKENRKSRNSLGKCIACKDGEVLENSKAFYCSHWKKNCKFTVWKNSLELYGQKVTREMIELLIQDGRIDDFHMILPQTKERCTATLQFKEDKSGALQLKNVKRIESKN